MKKNITKIKINICFIFLACTLMLFGCGVGGNENQTGQDTPKKATGVEVKVYFPGGTSSKVNHRKFSTDLGDVGSVDIVASWGGGSTGTIACNLTSPATYWVCNMTDLPAGIPVTVSISAKKADTTVLYTGTETLTLTVGIVSSLAISMQPVIPDIANLHIPVVSSVAFATTNAVMGIPLAMDVTIEGKSGDTIASSYVSNNGGTFAPVTGSVAMPISGSTIIRIFYTAAIQVANYTDRISVRLKDVSTGFDSTFEFNVNVVRNSSIGSSSLNFPPSITGINVDVNVAGMATLTAIVSDESPATLIYEWNSGDGVIRTTNPITVSQPPLDTLINVKVTDEKGAFHSYSMIWGNLTAQASAVKLAKTGQTTSYYTSDDGALQRGIAWPTPRFTAGIGVEADCVTDNLTGMMWVKSPDSTLRTWQGGLDYSNNLTLCGFSDWRLPNRKELRSLINYSQTTNVTWLNAQGFSNVQSNNYWSSTSNANNTGSAWIVYMDDGNLDFDFKDSSYYAWPVRSGQ